MIFKITFMKQIASKTMAYIPFGTTPNCFDKCLVTLETTNNIHARRWQNVFCGRSRANRTKSNEKT